MSVNLVRAEERQIVVARYNEDLAWLRRIDVPAYVYNKGEAFSVDYQPAGVRTLPNEGREAHTFLTHIIEEYDRLAEIVFFVQGDPFAHCRGLMHHLGAAGAGFGAFTWLADWLPTDSKHGWPNAIGFPLGRFYEDVFGSLSPESFTFGAGAQFATRRPVIRSKPRSWYEHVLNVCRTRYSQEYPWIIERMWELVIAQPT